MHKPRHFGFTLIEMLLGVVIIMGALVGVYQLLSRAKINAAVETEQKHLAVIVDGVSGAYMAAAGYEGLTTEDVLNLGISGLQNSEGQLNSSFSGNVLVRPATAMATNDSFDVVYQELDRRTCIAFTKAAFATSFTIYVGEIGASEGTQVQMTHGAAEGRLVNEPDLIQACSAPQFDSGQGTVAFRFYDKKLGTVDELDPACTCAPDTAEQYMSCPLGQIGSIQQRQTSACTGGTPACPTAEWSPWVTIQSTCAIAPPNFVPPGYVSDPPTSCIPSTARRIYPCPTGEVGVIVEERTSTCPGPYTSPWGVVSNTCAPIVGPPTACVPDVDAIRNDPCPMGQGGSITMQRSSSCPNPYGSPVWGSWVLVGSTCSATCVATDTCCQPQTEERNSVAPCSAGTYGSTAGDEIRTSSCASSTATPVWGGWISTSTSGSCNACPPNTTSVEVQWVPSSATCPTGQVGSHTWEREQSRTQSLTYSCPAGTIAMPYPTVGAWSTYADTGNIRNEVNTCIAKPAVTHNRFCAFTSYNNSWSIGGNTCTGGVASYGLITLEEGHPMNVSDLSWGIMVTPQKGTAEFHCDTAQLDALVALHGSDPDPFASAGIGLVQDCPVGGAHSDGTPFATGEKCQFFWDITGLITTVPKTCSP